MIFLQLNLHMSKFLCTFAAAKVFIVSTTYTYHPSSAECRNIFTASCVESVAKALNQPADKIYRRMARVNLIDDYIIPCYEVLHSESRENITKDIIYTLELWEQKQGI